MKDFDLEKEVDNYINDNFSECQDGVLISDRDDREVTYIDLAECARHFFALGLKAKQG